MRDIKKLQDPTSRLRELDMFCEALDPQTVEASIVVDACTQLRAGFIERFAAESTQKAITRVVGRIKDVPWRRCVRQSGLDAQELVRRVSQMRTDYELQMAHVSYDDQEAVHDVRKLAKALRYVTREFAELLPDAAEDTNTRAKAVQDMLGELCDCWNNAQLVIEICGPQAVQVASRFVVRADGDRRRSQEESQLRSCDKRFIGFGIGKMRARCPWHRQVVFCLKSKVFYVPALVVVT